MLESHFIVNPSRFTIDSAPAFSTDVVGVGAGTTFVEDGNRWVNGVNVAEVVEAEVVVARTFPTLVQKPSNPETTE